MRLPLTGRRVVDMVTAALFVDDGRRHELADGVTVEEVKAKTKAEAWAGAGLKGGGR